MQFSRFRASRRVVRSHTAGRSYLDDTGIDALNAGEAPDRIDRDIPLANDGLIGNMVAGWPYDGNSLPIPHHYVPRRPMTVQPFVRGIDPGVTIPAIYVGEPTS